MPLPSPGSYHLYLIYIYNLYIKVPCHRNIFFTYFQTFLHLFFYLLFLSPLLYVNILMFFLIYMVIFLI